MMLELWERKARVMTNAVLKMGAVAALGFLSLAALPQSASAHASQRVQQRCDSDGDRCAVFRCDWDGDDCVQISPWRRAYATYDRQRYGYSNGYYGGQYDRGDGYDNAERAEEWRERHRDSDDEENDGD